MANTITDSVGRNGINRADDVRVVQSLLRLIPADGVVTAGLVLAIENYQRTVLGVSEPDGRIDPGGRTFRSLTGPADPGDAPWVEIARAEIGTREIRGPANNPRVLEYIATFPYLKGIWHDERRKDYRLSDVDETAWCACFVNWCLLRAGRSRGPSASAKDWMTYGFALPAPKVGAICVVHHAPSSETAGVTSTGYHVAFWTGGAGDSITLLGGNQATADRATEEVNEKATKGYWTVQAYRWPL